MSKKVKDLEVLVAVAIKYKAENREILISDLKRARSNEVRKIKQVRD